LREAEGGFREIIGLASSSNDLQASAWNSLGDVLIDAGRLDEAAAALERAYALLARDANTISNDDFKLVRARLTAAMGKPEVALRSLDGDAARMLAQHNLRTSFEVRFATAEIELHAHRATAASHLEELARDASPHGFLRIAHSARALAAH